MDIIDIVTAKKYADKQIGIYLTSGATPKGSWNAATNTPIIQDGVGSVGWFYDVTNAGTWNGIAFLVGDRVMYNSSHKWERVATGVESETPMVVQFIDQTTSHLPTTRASGKDLKVGDYVQVLSTATLPFTIDGLYFDSYSDIAEWTGTTWQLKSFSSSKTNEVEVSDKTTESIGGSSSYQSEINVENKNEILKRVEDIKNEDNALSIDTTDKKNVKANVKVSVTQGESVNFTKESDGLKVEVEFGDTTKKGIVKLDDTPSSTENTTAATPKGAHITLEKQETAEDGYLSTYVLKQGGVALTEKINIPKDYLVKSGSVKTCVTENVPVSGYKVGDKYIDFIVNVKEGTATDEHIYLLCKELVDVYTSGSGVEVTSENKINAKDINSTHLQNGVLRTEIRLEESASDTNWASEKAIRTELDKKINKNDITLKNKNVSVSFDENGDIKFTPIITVPVINTFSVSPNEIESGNPTTITISVNAAKGDYNLDKAVISYNGTTKTITGLVSEVTSQTTITLSIGTTLTCVVYDTEGNASEMSYAYVSESTPTATSYLTCKNGSFGQVVISNATSKSYSTSKALAGDGFIYKYPMSFGLLSSINANGDECISIFTQSTEVIGGVNYYVYTQLGTISGTFNISFN